MMGLSFFLVPLTASRSALCDAYSSGTSLKKVLAFGNEKKNEFSFLISLIFCTFAAEFEFKQLF